jgi:hypothetical protein
MVASPFSQPIFASPRVRIVLTVAAGLGLLIGIQTGLLHLQMDPLADVHAYYDAGARLNAGQPLYEQSATTNEAEFYRYPPMLAILFRPLALLPFAAAAAIWETILIVSCIALIWRANPRRKITWLALGWLAAPLAWTLTIGQAQMLVAFLMTGATPLSLALATHLKVFPILAAVYWAGRREWGTLLRFIGWVAAIGAICFVLEPAATLQYLTFLSLEQVGEVRNLSPYAISPALWAIVTVLLLGAAVWLAPTRAGWFTAVALSVFATPRLLMYQFVTFLSALVPPADSSRRAGDSRSTD